MKLDEHIFAGFYTVVTALEWKWMLASEPCGYKFSWAKFYEEERKEYSF